MVTAIDALVDSWDSSRSFLALVEYVSIVYRRDEHVCVRTDERVELGEVRNRPPVQPSKRGSGRRQRLFMTTW